MNDQFDQLTQYIRTHLQQGIQEDFIRDSLLKHNWVPEIVDFAFAQVKAETAMPIPEHPDAPQQPQ